MPEIQSEQNSAEHDLQEQNELNRMKAAVWEIAANSRYQETEMVDRIINLIGPYMKVSRVSYSLLLDDGFKCVQEWAAPGVKSSLNLVIPRIVAEKLLTSDVAEFSVDVFAKNVPVVLRPFVMPVIELFTKGYNIRSVWGFRFFIDGKMEGALSIDVNFDNAHKPELTKIKQEIILEIVKIMTGSISRLRLEKERLEAETKYTDLYEHIHDALIFHEWDPEKGPGKILAVNQGLSRLLGYEKHEIMGKALSAFTETGAAGKKSELAMGQTGEAVFERIFINKNSSRIPVEVKAKIVEAGGRKFVLAIARDLTERKIAEASLRLSEEKYRTLFENMSDGFAYHQIVLDAKGRPADYKFLEINNSFEKTLNMKKEEVIGKNVTDVIPGIKNGPFDWVSVYGGVALTGKSVKFEQYDSYSKKWYSVTAYSNKTGFFATVFADITEKKQAEEEIRKLSIAVEQSASTIVITDLKGNIEYANKKFEETTGYSKKEALGQNPRLLKSGHFKSEEYTHLWETITKGRDWHGEFHNKKKNGDLYWEVAVISPIKDNEGHITSFIAVKDDVTEKKLAQEKIAESYKKLKELDALKTVFTAMITHELRTPMTSIKGYASLLLGGAAGEISARQTEFLGNIKTSSDKLLVMINDMLDAAKMEAGEFNIEKKPNDLAKTIATALEAVYSISEKKSITFDFTKGNTLCVAEYDEERVSQVVVNLVNNAVKFSPDGSKVSVGIITDPKEQAGIPGKLPAIINEKQCVVVFIKDEGSGVADKDAVKLFERFYQAENAAGHKGTGLGLSICRSIVEAHSGAIWFESKGKNKGTIFYFALPVK